MCMSHCLLSALACCAVTLSGLGDEEGTVGEQVFGNGMVGELYVNTSTSTRACEDMSMAVSQPLVQVVPL